MHASTTAARTFSWRTFPVETEPSSWCAVKLRCRSAPRFLWEKKCFGLSPQRAQSPSAFFAIRKPFIVDEPVVREPNSMLMYGHLYHRHGARFQCRGWIEPFPLSSDSDA